MPDFRLPDLGEGLTEAEIVSWRVAVGDEVQVDQTVVEVETAKAVVEVPVPFAGIVSSLHAQPGDTVAVGSPLISVSVTPAHAGLHEPGIVVPDNHHAAPADADSSGNVLIGYGTSASPRRRRRARVAAAAPPTPAAPVPTTVAPMRDPRRVPVISPLVRRLARDSGVDLAAVAASGPEGIVLRRDVERAIADTTTSVTTAATASAPSDASVVHASDPGEQRIPLRGVRKAVADKLTRSRREIPEATVWVDVDATELLAARATLNAVPGAEPVSVLAMLGRFAVLALRRYPELNGRVEDDEIVLSSKVNLGFAAQTERGLVVPVIPAADRLTLRELASALAGRTTSARAGQLSPSELSGGTFTVNNYGVFGVDGSAAIINYPEVAILGIGRIIDRPWVVDGALCVRKVTQLTLAFDHRVCDGAVAGGFLRTVADWVESPLRALGDL